MPVALQMSQPARAGLVERFEGLRLSAYRDSVGIWTIGYGHTARAGQPSPAAGMRVTSESADRLLSADLAMFEAALNGAIKVATLQREFDALVSWAFNVGVGAMQSSSLLRAFNQCAKAQAADGLLAWDRAGGAVLAGLANRRQAERAWFLGVAPPEPVSLMGADDQPLGDQLAHAVDHPDTFLTRVAARLELAFG